MIKVFKPFFLILLIVSVSTSTHAICFFDCEDDVEAQLKLLATNSLLTILEKNEIKVDDINLEKISESTTKASDEYSTIFFTLYNVKLTSKEYGLEHGVLKHNAIKRAVVEDNDINILPLETTGSLFQMGTEEEVSNARLEFKETVETQADKFSVESYVAKKYQ